jgi:hypothetical protein
MPRNKAAEASERRPGWGVRLEGAGASRIRIRLRFVRAQRPLQRSRSTVVYLGRSPPNFHVVPFIRVPWL